MCTHSDDPAAVAAPTTERDVDAQYPEESLRAAEASSECAGVSGPAGPVTRYPISPAVGASMQKVGGGPGPAAALVHDLAHARGDRVAIDNVPARIPTVSLVS